MLADVSEKKGIQLRSENFVVNPMDLKCEQIIMNNGMLYTLSYRRGVFETDVVTGKSNNLTSSDV